MHATEHCQRVYFYRIDGELTWQQRVIQSASAPFRYHAREEEGRNDSNRERGRIPGIGRSQIKKRIALCLLRKQSRIDRQKKRSFFIYLLTLTGLILTKMCIIEGVNRIGILNSVHEWHPCFCRFRVTERITVGLKEIG